MPRYNKIFAGPFTEATPQVQEATCAATLLPGSLVVWSAGVWAAAGAATLGKVFVVQDNYLNPGATVDTPWAIGDRVPALEILDEQLIRVRVATGNNLAKGDALTPAAAGLVAKAATGDKVIGYSEETYNNNTGASQLVTMRGGQGYVTA
jgi:hypothetical protein